MSLTKYKRMVDISDSLEIKNPKLAAEWHTIKNDLTPREVTCGSAKKAWWICPYGHEYDAPISRRQQGHGCPVCSGRRVIESTSLYGINPILTTEWHSTKNGDLSPKCVSPYSHKKAWWYRKECGHEWDAVIKSRQYGAGCPYCAGIRIDSGNCLATINPKLASEWHCIKNELTPDEVSPFSHLEVWWLGQCGHEWLSQIKDRHMKGTRCPYCYGNWLTDDGNCLATINPTLATEWHTTKNGDLTPKDIRPNSNVRVWWHNQECNHEWQCSVANRHFSESGCPYCNGSRKIDLTNCLATVNPKLALEWHPIKNGDVTPYVIAPNTENSYWWIGQCGHEWDDSPAHRNFSGRGCPFCAGKRVGRDNCLAASHPHYFKEWHSIKNGELTPHQVTTFSSKRAWWICEKGHEWHTIISSRTGNESGCPVCCESKGEREVARILSKLDLVFKRQVKFNECRNIHVLPFDFGVYNGENVRLIEYQGEQHYMPVSFGSKNTNPEQRLMLIQKRDFIKRVYCKQNGIPLLEIPYWSRGDIEKLISSFLEEVCN